MLPGQMSQGRPAEREQWPDCKRAVKYSGALLCSFWFKSVQCLANSLQTGCEADPSQAHHCLPAAAALCSSHPHQCLWHICSLHLQFGGMHPSAQQRHKTKYTRIIGVYTMYISLSTWRFLLPSEHNVPQAQRCACSSHVFPSLWVLLVSCFAKGFCWAQLTKWWSTIIACVASYA